jgi:acyl-CoA dehydrogenase
VTDRQVERDLVALAHEFAANEIRPVAARFDETEEFPADVIRKAAKVGLTGFDLPEEHGGGGIDSVRTACLIGEELAWGDAPIGSLIGSASFFADPLAALATEEQRDRWIRPLAPVQRRPAHHRARDHRARRGFGRGRDHDDSDQGR